MARVRVAHDVTVRVDTPFPAVDAVEMDLRPDILKYSDIRFHGQDRVAGSRSDDQYKVWKFEVKGHYIEIWKDTRKAYNSMVVAVDGAVRDSGNLAMVKFRYPWFKEFLG